MSEKQKIVLILAIGYVIVLGILTLFSNQLMKASLPEVNTYRVTNTYISGEYYDTVVSKECISFDEEGAIIYELVERDTPLGTRYYVRKQRIEIRAEDERMAAVRPVLDWKTQIIQNSSRELEDGMQVNVSAKK